MELKWAVVADVDVELKWAVVADVDVELKWAVVADVDVEWGCLPSSPLCQGTEKFAEKTGPDHVTSLLRHREEHHTLKYPFTYVNYLLVKPT